MANEIKDFGEHIGGARKEVWAANGLSLNDIWDMNDAERDNYIIKDNVWPRPNWEKRIAEGAVQGVCFWQNEMRKAVQVRPFLPDRVSQENYIKTVTRLRDAVMAVNSLSEIDSFYSEYFSKPENGYILGTDRAYYVEVQPEAKSSIDNAVLKVAQVSGRTMAKQAAHKMFGVPKNQRVYLETKNNLMAIQLNDERVERKYAEHPGHYLVVNLNYSHYYFYPLDVIDLGEADPELYCILDKSSNRVLMTDLESEEAAEEFIENYAKAAQSRATELAKKSAKDKRKKLFVPPQLQGLERTGPEYLYGMDANGQRYLDDMKFRGGEFGNYMGDTDRQASLTMGYLAFRDLARILGISKENISFDGQLAIAFGARGRGSATGAAHYEPMRQVINLTKMSGAGCLAHEWGHALDDYIGRKLGFGAGKFASVAAVNSGKVAQELKSMQELMDAMMYKTVEIPPDQVNPEIKRRLGNYRYAYETLLDEFRPKKMTSAQAEKWDKVAEDVMAERMNFSYVDYGGGRGRQKYDGPSRPIVEVFSDLTKRYSGKGISKSQKHLICNYLTEMYRLENQLAESKGRTQRVKTDFYKGSMEFDRLYSRTGQGYWQSEQEMFARVFDCYVDSKLKDAGVRSDYLSCFANIYVMPSGKGTVYAIPVGDERKVIFEKIDALMAELKEKGLLHAYQEPVAETTVELSPEQRREDAALKRFLSCEWVMAITPSGMTEAQQKTWMDNVGEVFRTRYDCDECLSAIHQLSELRVELTGGQGVSLLYARKMAEAMESIEKEIVESPVPVTEEVATTEPVIENNEIEI